MQKAIQNALAQQKTENQALVKKVTELQSQMTQQTQVPAPQTVEPVRQPKGPPSSLQTEEGVLNKAELDADYPVKPFQRPRQQRNNNSARIDRMEERLNETRDAVSETRDSINQLSNQFQKLNIHKPVARSNFNRSYFKPITPINFQHTPPTSDNEGDGYDEDNNRWTGYDPPVKKKQVNEPRSASYKLAGDTNAISPSESSQPETYDELLPKLSPAMRKMCLSRKAQKEKSKKDEWFSLLQYLNASINDLPISESFLDNGSEFDGFNLATAEELGWKVDKPSKFAVKGNSEHISKALGWYTNVAVTLKDMKGNLIITIVGNYACVDNGEPKPMLWLGTTGIRKVKGISNLTKNQFCIEDHGKTYIIPTFSKAPVVKDPPKENQESANSSNPTSEEDLKKSVKNLKSAS
ncbi:hypothetical protein GLOIN_2v1822626 [Rhizophagus irregularis DAOM 181602=DAOM 197198]|nr:hypothetical protein GLOIN_2v1822626 [Rhizophagus irregularis DAOM 181602=DAOM 197198]